MGLVGLLGTVGLMTHNPAHFALFALLLATFEWKERLDPVA